MVPEQLNRSSTVKRPATLIEQFDPMYGYDENGRWNGMTPDEVKVWLEQHRRETDYLRRLQRFDHHNSLPN